MTTDLGGWDEAEAEEDLEPGEDTEDGDAPPQPYYPHVGVFVSDLLAPTYRRHLDGRTRTWCPQWWKHAEAIVRLEALWRAWEHLRLDPATGTSVWLRDHADHHMAVLMDPEGPLKGCNPTKGHGTRLEPLPVEEPPRGLFA